MLPFLCILVTFLSYDFNSLQSHLVKEKRWYCFVCPVFHFHYCVFMFLLSNFSRFHSSIETLLSCLSQHSPFLSFYNTVLTFLFYLHIPTCFFAFKIFSYILFSLSYPSSLFLLCSSFGNVFISQEIHPHLHSSRPL